MCGRCMCDWCVISAFYLVIHEQMVRTGSATRIIRFSIKKKEEENKKAEKLVKLIVNQTLATFSMLKLFTQDV